MVRLLGIIGCVALAGALLGDVLGVAGDGSRSAVAAMARRPGQAEKQQTRAARKPPPVLFAVGDIADCTSEGDEATVRLIEDRSGTVAALGDLAYENGSQQDFANCYDPSWGAVKSRTRPAPGNHEYYTNGASGYFDYFGAAAGNPAKGYYSYDRGAWHIIALNSNCEEIGGCEADSPQGRWLLQDLRAHPAKCTLAYWHHPLFSSGEVHGGDAAMGPFWQMLYTYRADVVLSGHEHNYERFAPQDAAGKLDLKRGIREFVVGTGGRGHYGFDRPLATSQVRNDDTFGVLALTLRRKGCTWNFLPARLPGDPAPTFRDTGSDDCGKTKKRGQKRVQADQRQERDRGDARAERRRT